MLSPLVFVALGMVMARAAKARRIWTRHGRFVYTAGSLAFTLVWLVMVSLLADLPWIQGWASHLPGGSGPAWMWSSGIFPPGSHEALGEEMKVLLPILAFTLTPFWYMLGVVAGFWLFGRSPKQSGVLGLLR